MFKQEIHVGGHYALRERRSNDAAVQHVRILQHVRGTKWKAEWVEPNPGLVDYVRSQNLLIPWKDLKPFLRDEEHYKRLLEHNEAKAYKENSTVTNALYEVFESMGESDLHFYRGVLAGSPEALERVRNRAGVDAAATSPVSYMDRGGDLHIAFDEAMNLAQAFCAAEPLAVLVGVEATEREWTQKASKPGGEYMVSLLNEYRASWAILRQWTGEAALAHREAVIQRLERLLWDAIYALQRAGADEEAHRLRRAVKRE